MYSYFVKAKTSSSGWSMIMLRDNFGEILDHMLKSEFQFHGNNIIRVNITKLGGKKDDAAYKRETGIPR